MDTPLQATEAVKAIETVFGASLDKLIIILLIVIVAVFLVQMWSNRNLVNNLMEQQRKRDDELYKDKSRLQDELDERDKRSVERHGEFMALQERSTNFQGELAKAYSALVESDNKFRTEWVQVKTDVNSTAQALTALEQKMGDLQTSVSEAVSALTSAREGDKETIRYQIAKQFEDLKNMVKLLKEETGEQPAVVEPLDAPPPLDKAS